MPLKNNLTAFTPTARNSRLCKGNYGAIAMWQRRNPHQVLGQTSRRWNTAECHHQEKNSVAGLFNRQTATTHVLATYARRQVRSPNDPKLSLTCRMKEYFETAGSRFQQNAFYQSISMGDARLLSTGMHQYKTPRQR